MMKKTQSLVLKNVKGIKGIRSFPNAVPKDEGVREEKTEKPQTQSINSSPSDKKDDEQLSGNLKIIHTASNILDDIDIKEMKEKKEDKKEEKVRVQPLCPKDEIDENDLRKLLKKSSSENIIREKEIASKKGKGGKATEEISSKQEIPAELKLNPIISKMYDTIGDKMTIEGYEGPKCHTFAMMKLREELIKSIINVLKWEYPSPIQSIGIMPVIEKRDLLCQAQAGTGKTATFMIAALQRVNTNLKNCQIIILSPARELAEQTFTVGVKLAAYMDVSFSLQTGGARARDERGVRYIHNVKPNRDGKYTTEKYCEQIVIATPGKLLMLLENGSIDPKNTILMVFDEADNILGQGFFDDIGSICKLMNDEIIKYALYSATLSPEIIQIAEKFMDEPVQILVPSEENVVTNNQKHYAIKVTEEGQKLEILSDIFTTTTGQVIVFVNRKYTAPHVYEHIKSLGIKVEYINGEMEQVEREAAMARFREGKCKVLIGTDIIARGIDTVVDLVINYDIPNVQPQYVHRIGRTGRFGKDGNVVNIVSRDDEDKLQRINFRYKIKKLDFKLFMERPSIKI